MEAIKLSKFEKKVGQGFMGLRKRNFPARGWSSKTVGNVIYIFALPSLKYIKFHFYMTSLESKTGKQVKWCPVPKGFIKLAV